MSSNLIKDISHDLVEKKLWIPAVFLVILCVAFPVVIMGSGESTAEPVAQPAGLSTEEGPQLALTRAATTGFARPARVNDDRLDPFASRAADSSLKKAADSLGKAADSVIDGGKGGGGGGGGPTPGPKDQEPKTPEPDTEPEVQTESDDLLSILVTDPGTPDAEPLQISDIRTLSPLVDPENPFLVYVGKTSDESASFLVSADVTVSGDGTCAPSPTDCRTLTLGIGRTAEFTLVADQSKKLTITVLDIETKEVPISDDAPASSDPGAVPASVARKAGAKALKSVLSDDEVVKSLTAQKVKLRS
ncbi:MAG: hypothetical protein JHD16_08545 [Solirubrobacteraceae bacterium]|nr:hypothetical protein [Solirubrobacteraceae bacterium]